MHLYGWGTYIHKNILWGQARTWGFNNHRNNKCDLTSHYPSLTSTKSLLVINPISSNNKDKH